MLSKNPTLRERLRVRRQEVALQQREAAALVVVDAETWMWWERDERQSYVYQHPAIISFLGCEPWPELHTLPGRLLAYRRRNGLATTSAAEIYGSNEGTWRRLKQGKRRPQGRHAQGIDQLLRLPSGIGFAAS